MFVSTQLNVLHFFLKIFSSVGVLSIDRYSSALVISSLVACLAIALCRSLRSLTLLSKLFVSRS